VRAMTVVAAAVAVLTIGVLVLVLGSSTPEEGAPDPVASLDAVIGTWEASAGPDAPAEPVAPVRLTFAEGGMFFETGCNTGRGSATVEDGRLVGGPFATTRKACVPPLDEQEAWVLEMLAAAPQLGLVGTNELTLSWGDGYQLVFTRVADSGSDSPTPRV
jgi:heat shock protein HslJ